MTVKIPHEYKRSDFSDLVKNIAKKTKPSFDDKTLTLSSKLYTAFDQVTRFGKTFNVIVVAAYGHANICIMEDHEPSL